MNKSKKTEFKKTLVRNTELPLSKTKVVIEDKGENHEKIITVTNKDEKLKSSSGVSKLQVQLSESNTIKHKSDVRECKSQKSIKSSDVAFSEKITRKINFPPNKSIFRDLIPLDVPSKSLPQLTAREPLPQKDKDPVLSNYTKPSKSREFVYIPSVKPERTTISTEIDNLRLYRIIQMNNQ